MMANYPRSYPSSCQKPNHSYRGIRCRMILKIVPGHTALGRAGQALHVGSILNNFKLTMPKNYVQPI